MTPSDQIKLLREKFRIMVDAAVDHYSPSHHDKMVDGIMAACDAIILAATEQPERQSETSAAKDKDALTDAVDWNRETWRKDYKSTDGTTNQPVQLPPSKMSQEDAQKQEEYIWKNTKDATQEEEIRMLRRELHALQDNYNPPMREFSRNETLVTWIRTKDRMPQPHHTVIVEGGLAMWSGDAWRSMTGDNSGRVIQWPVLYWTPMITPPLTDVEV